MTISFLPATWTDLSAQRRSSAKAAKARAAGMLRLSWWYRHRSLSCFFPMLGWRHLHPEIRAFIFSCVVHPHASALFEHEHQAVLVLALSDYRQGGLDVAWLPDVVDCNSIHMLQACSGLWLWWGRLRGAACALHPWTFAIPCWIPQRCSSKSTHIICAWPFLSLSSWLDLQTCWVRPNAEEAQNAHACIHTSAHSLGG